MDVKEQARCIFFFLRAIGIPEGKVLRGMFVFFDISIHDVALRASVSDQFVRKCLAGIRVSERVDEAVKELLFGSGASVDFRKP